MISVIMPVYNGEKFVAQALQSVQAQTVSDWELDRSLPDVQLLMRLAQTLDTTPEQLMGDALPPGCDQAAVARYLFAAKQQLMERNRRRRFYGRIRLGILSGLGIAVALLLLLWLVGLILS